MFFSRNEREWKKFHSLVTGIWNETGAVNEWKSISFIHSSWSNFPMAPACNILMQLAATSDWWYSSTPTSETGRRIPNMHFGQSCLGCMSLFLLPFPLSPPFPPCLPSPIDLPTPHIPHHLPPKTPPLIPPHPPHRCPHLLPIMVAHHGVCRTNEHVGT